MIFSKKALFLAGIGALSLALATPVLADIGYPYTFQTSSSVTSGNVATWSQNRGLQDGGTAFTSVVTLTGAQTLSNKTLTDPIMTNDTRVTTQTDVTSSTTLVPVTGLSAALTAGKTYLVQVYLPATAGASGGIKVALGTPDTLTATSASITGKNYNGTTLNANSTVTALGSAVAGATAVTTDVTIQATIVVNAAGTLNVQMAQNASNGTTTSALINGYMIVTRIN